MFSLNNTPESNGTITMQTLQQLLITANETASYFSDPVLTEKQIEAGCDEVWSSVGAGKQIAYAKLVTPLAEHQLMQDFAAGRGTVRFPAGAP